MGLSVHHSVPMKHLLHNCGISGCETSGRRSVSTDNESQILWNFGDSMTFCIHHHHQVTFSLLSHACTCKTCFIPIHVSSSARSEINDVILTKRFACLSTICWFMSKFSSAVPEKVDIKNFIEEQPRKRAEKWHQSTFCTVTAGLPTGQSWQPAQPPHPPQMSHILPLVGETTTCKHNNDTLLSSKAIVAHIIPIYLTSSRQREIFSWGCVYGQQRRLNLIFSFLVWNAKSSTVFSSISLTLLSGAEQEKCSGFIRASVLTKQWWDRWNEPKQSNVWTIKPQQWPEHANTW